MTDTLMKPTLVLNSAFLPVSIVRVFEALCLIVTDKANLLESDTTEEIRSQKLVFPLPRVIRLTTYSGMPLNPSWSRLKVLYRDDQKCAWCGKRGGIEELDCDHIIPKSRWYECPTDRRRVHESPKRKLHNTRAPWNSWQNTVASCRSCNARKGNKYPWEIGMKLLWPAIEPEYVPSLVVSFDRARQLGWLDYLLNSRGKPILPSAVKVIALPVTGK